MSRLDAAHHALVTRLAALRVPRIVGEPDGADIRNLADHMIEIADGVDAYLEAIGRELAANAPCAVDTALFKRPLFAAIDGNALFEAHRIADRLDEDRRDFAPPVRAQTYGVGGLGYRAVADSEPVAGTSVVAGSPVSPPSGAKVT
jgi:hypothetical protein